LGSQSQFGSSFGGGDKKKDEKGKGDDPAKFVPQEYHNPAYLEVLTGVFNARNMIGTKAKEKDKKKGGRGGRQIGDNASYYSGAKTAVTAVPEENLSDYEKEPDYM
jgi:hypothetical protein